MEELKREFVVITDDPEISGIHIMLEVLRPLNSDQRRRIINYVESFADYSVLYKDDN